MNLKLKHLAPYFPYGLEIKILNHKCDYVGVEYSTVNGYYFLGERLHVTYEGGRTGKSDTEFIPILHPLSDLDKEVEMNTIKVIPAEVLDSIYKFIGTPEDLKNHIIDTIKIDSTPRWIMKKLFRWHFDVFGLIEKGLAIDINTLK